MCIYNKLLHKVQFLYPIFLSFWSQIFTLVTANLSQLDGLNVCRNKPFRNIYVVLEQVFCKVESFFYLEVESRLHLFD